MKKLVIFFLLIASTASVNSAVGATSVEPKIDQKVIKKITKQLKTMHDAGVKIHSTYDLTTTSEVQACHGKYGYLRVQGKELIEFTKTPSRSTNEWCLRVELDQAIYAAFACVSCTGAGEKCKDVPPAIKKVDKILKDDAAGN